MLAYSPHVFHNAHYCPLHSPCAHSITAILVYRFLINLQEANLHDVKIDSDDPLYISSCSANTFPSFVAAPNLERLTVDSTRREGMDDTD